MFPGGPFLFDALQYCNAALALLVTLRPRTDPNALRVYVRTRDERTYREIPAPPKEEFWAACACADVPVAYLSATTQPAAALVLYRCELPVPALHPLPEPRMEGEHARVWLCALHSASSDGAHLLVTAGIQPKPAPDGGYTIRFVLGQFAVASGAISVVAELPATFA